MPTIDFNLPIAQGPADLKQIKLSIPELLRKIEVFVESSTAEEIKNSTVMYWLTSIIFDAIVKKEEPILKEVSKIVCRLAETSPETMISMLQTIMSLGNEKEVSALYLWMDAFYTAMFDQKSYAYVSLVTELFELLLQNENANELATTFMPSQETQNDKKSPLFIFSQALLQSTKAPFSPKATAEIATFYQRTLSHLELTKISDITERMSQGAMAGKSIVYLLACALKEAARTNLEVVTIVSSIFKDLITEQPQNALRELSTPITEGPYKGLLPLHIILNALISVAYIDDNINAVNQITSILTCLAATHSKFKPSLAELFQIPITHGLNQGKNGLNLLKTAQEKANLSKIPTQHLDLLIDCIEEEQFMVELTSSVISPRN